MKTIRIFALFYTLLIPYLSYSQPDSPNNEATGLIDSLQYFIKDNDSLKFSCLAKDLNKRGDYNKISKACFSTALHYNRGFAFNLLVNQGAKLDPTSPTDWNPLSEACRKGNIEMARLLLRLGASVNPKFSKAPIINYAAQSGNVALVQMLLKFGASVNPDFEGPGPLQIAATKGNLELSKILIGSGAKINYRYKNQTALSNSLQNNHNALATWLIAEGADVDSLLLNNKMLPGTFAMLEAGCETCFLATNPDKVNANVLVEQTSLLHLAASKNLTRVIPALVVAGTDINARNPLGLTPIMLAALEGHTDPVQELIKLGANLNILNHDKQSAVDLAIKEKHFTIARMLLKNGAKTWHPNTQKSLAGIPKTARGPETDELSRLMKVK